MADIATFLDFQKLLKIKRYSENSINTYLGLIKLFNKYVGFQIDLESLENKQLLAIIIQIVHDKNLAYTTHKQLCAALKLFYREMYSRDIDFSPVYPTRRPSPLPNIISTKEVKAILESHNNIKHKAMLTAIYALGLRSGELINIKIEDINSDRNQIFIRSGKGRKDRVLPLPNSLRVLFREYYLQYRPKNYLFCGRNGDKYAPESLRKVFKMAVFKAGINKHITLHSLRHAYATHLMDRGTDVRIIKELLGHSSIKTTLIYTHVTQKTLENIPSPIDFL